MIDKTNYISKILKVLPEFQERWELHIKYWGDEHPSVCLSLAELAHYIVDVLQDPKTSDNFIQQIFNLIENLLNEGDKEIRDAVCTCVLESIVNRTEIDTSLFVYHLGNLSRNYLIAWDEFTGVKTKGLYDNL